ncbi:MAG: hypothetical protein BWY43_00187 [candidate division WS2 bacterium ADurb.Bin280]|uniref:PPM-type phosphatase domain-containing protein n=1 Tax=candidate division WS2 bacterium ADurb.Bin280 TaxID=1852829 RepID=A0A1V5SFN2_9BACT|nr:MAG: hypothetical protein BWY43_00187 [candidate division WS2 bacterium ADurb.Bin280]
MTQIINYTRITTSDKLEDRFLTCQVYEPAETDQANAGRIFSQIEILNPWFPNSQIGQTVINTLIREYYRSSSSSDLQNFEAAVKKVNEALAQIAQNGETEWIGKFSGILMLSKGKDIHIAQTGNSRAYLFRGSRINHITEGLSQGEAPHPLKTFTNLTSGELHQGDRLIIGNSTLFQVFSPSELRISATSYLPMACAIEIAKGLKRKGAHSGNGIVIELTTKDELANIPPEQKVDTVYLDQSGFDINYFLRNITQTATKMLLLVSKKSSSLHKYTRENISPKLKKTLESSKKEIGSITSRASKRFSVENTISPSLQQVESKTGTSQIKSSSGGTDSINKKTTIKNLSFIKAISLIKMRNKFKRFLISSGLHSKNRTKLIAWSIFAVFIILLVSIAISLNMKKSQDRDQALQAKSTEITSLSGEASLAISRNQTDEAIDKLNELLKISTELAGTKYENSIKDIVKDSEKKLASLSSVTVVDKAKEFDISPNAQSLTQINKSLFYFNKSDGIFSKNENSENFEIVINKEFDSESSSSTPLTNDKEIAYLLENHSIHIVNTENLTTQEQSVELNSGSIIRQYLDNLYVLDIDNNQIWRIPRAENEYNETQKYIRDDTVLALYSDMAIDGSIYLLNEQCEILKLARGRFENRFKIDPPGSQEINTGCKKIIASPTQENIFVLRNSGDKLVLMEINKEGKFIKQYEMQSSDEVIDIAFTEDPKALFIRTTNKISQYNL